MRTTLRTAAVMLLLSTPAWAQGVERRQDRRELRQDRRETRDDRRDSAQSSTLLARYEAARQRGDGATIAALDTEALALIDRELGEGRAEAARDTAEAARSRGEVVRSRHERNTTVAPVARADDRRDLRDDRRDARDDRRDAATERADLAWLRTLRADFAGLAGRTDRASVDRKHGLLRDFQQRAGWERGTNTTERREDRVERREDRREAREVR